MEAAKIRTTIQRVGNSAACIGLQAFRIIVVSSIIGIAVGVLVNYLFHVLGAPFVK